MEYVRRSELPRYGRQTAEAKETSAEFAKLSYFDLPLSLSGRHYDLDNFLGREGFVEQVAFARVGSKRSSFSGKASTAIN